MPRKAQDLASRAERFAAAWERLFPRKTFSGLTLAEFRETFKPCREVRVALAQLASETKTLLFRRRKLDRATHPILVRVFLAVRADPEAGEDASMFHAMGYVPKQRRRKPGRKRKARAASTSAPAALQPGQRIRPAAPARRRRQVPEP
jgi:hypothetical protein